MLCLPMAGMAQNQWERPDIQEKKAVKTEKEVTTEDPKYLEGAVPVVNGEVCWTLDLSVPGKNAQQIYDLVLNYLADLVKQENQLEGSSVSLVNKSEQEPVPVARPCKTFLQPDRGVLGQSCESGFATDQLPV